MRRIVLSVVSNPQLPRGHISNIASNFFGQSTVGLVNVAMYDDVTTWNAFRITGTLTRESNIESLALSAENAPVNSGTRTSQRASNAERWRFQWCQLQQAAKQTVELPMIRDAMTIWRPFYITLMEQPMKHQSSALLGHYNGDNSTVVSYLHSKSVTPQLDFKILAIPNTTTNVNID